MRLGRSTITARVPGVSSSITSTYCSDTFVASLWPSSRRLASVQTELSGIRDASGIERALALPQHVRARSERPGDVGQAHQAHAVVMGDRGTVLKRDAHRSLPD